MASNGQSELRKVRIECKFCKVFNTFTIPSNLPSQEIYLECGKCAKQLDVTLPNNGPSAESSAPSAQSEPSAVATAASSASIDSTEEKKSDTKTVKIKCKNCAVTNTFQIPSEYKPEECDLECGKCGNLLSDPVKKEDSDPQGDSGSAKGSGKKKKKAGPSLASALRQRLTPANVTALGQTQGTAVPPPPPSSSVATSQSQSSAQTTAAYSSLLKEHESLRMQNQRLTTTYENARAQHTLQINELQARNDVLTKDLTELRRQLKTLTNENENYKKESEKKLHFSSKSAAEKDKFMRDQNKKMADLHDKFIEKCEELKEVHEKLRKNQEIEQGYETKLQEKDLEYERLKRDIESEKDTVLNLRKSLESVKLLQSKIHHAAIDSLETKFDAVNERIKQSENFHKIVIDKYKETIKALKEEIKKRDTTIEEKDEAIGVKMDEIFMVQNKLNKREARHNEIYEELKEQKNECMLEIDALKEKNSENKSLYEQNMSRKTDEVDTKIKQIRELHKKVDTQKTHVKTFTRHTSIDGKPGSSSKFHNSQRTHVDSTNKKAIDSNDDDDMHAMPDEGIKKPALSNADEKDSPSVLIAYKSKYEKTKKKKRRKRSKRTESRDGKSKKGQNDVDNEAVDLIFTSPFDNSYASQMEIDAKMATPDDGRTTRRKRRRQATQNASNKKVKSGGKSASKLAKRRKAAGSGDEDVGSSGNGSGDSDTPYETESGSDSDGMRDSDSDHEIYDEDLCHICGKHGEVMCCDNCPKVFHTRCLGLQQVPEGEWYCDTCKKKRPKETSPKQWKCSDCALSFESRSELRQHLKQHSKGEGPFNCLYCEGFFEQKDEYDQHLESEHKDRLLKKKEEASQAGAFKIRKNRDNPPKPPKEGYKFERYLAETGSGAHIRMWKNDKGEEMFDCDCMHNPPVPKHKLPSLRTHVWRHSESDFDEDESVSPLKCILCQKDFPSEEELNEHMNLHTGLTPFECDKCEKKFAQRTDLEKHSLTHKRRSKSHIYECEQCDVYYPSSQQLKTHLSRHLDQPLECEKCHVVFWTKKLFGEHEDTHLYKPYQCSFCKMRFEQISELEEHKSMMYECDICKEKFSEQELPKHKEDAHPRPPTQTPGLPTERPSYASPRNKTKTKRGRGRGRGSRYVTARYEDLTPEQRQKALDQYMRLTGKRPPIPHLQDSKPNDAPLQVPSVVAKAETKVSKAVPVINVTNDGESEPIPTKRKPVVLNLEETVPKNVPLSTPESDVPIKSRKSVVPPLSRDIANVSVGSESSNISAHPTQPAQATAVEASSSSPAILKVAVALPDPLPAPAVAMLQTASIPAADPVPAALPPAPAALIQAAVPSSDSIEKKEDATEPTEKEEGNGTAKTAPSSSDGDGAAPTPGEKGAKLMQEGV